MSSHNRLRGVSLPVAVAALFVVDATSNTASAQWPIAPIWTGVYAGVHGAAAWNDVDTNGFGSFDNTASQFGGHLGLNFGLGPIVVGIEGDLNIENTDGRLSFASGDRISYEVDASGTVRGRLGIPIGPALLYATAGYAWLDVGTDLRTAAGGASSTSFSIDGIVYGIGAEAYVLPNVSVRLEALQFDYDEKTLPTGLSGIGALELDPSATVVRAGVSFRFN